MIVFSIHYVIFITVLLCIQLTRAFTFFISFFEELSIEYVRTDITTVEKERKKSWFSIIINIIIVLLLVIIGILVCSYHCHNRRHATLYVYRMNNKFSNSYGLLIDLILMKWNELNSSVESLAYIQFQTATATAATAATGMKTKKIWKSIINSKTSNV